MMRSVYSCLLLGLGAISASGYAAAQSAVTAATPNRTLPKMEAFTPFVLPAQPQPADFKRLREFVEPLIPVGTPTAEETQDFAAVVRMVLKQMPKTDFVPLEKFLADHPRSPWRAALQVNLAIGYYATGWYSKSLAASGEAWTLAKSSDDPDAHRLADRALAEWLKLNSRLGRLDVLERTFAEIKGRAVSPEVGTWVTSAYEAMSTMQTQPGFCFRCGPMALKEIQRARKAPGDWESFLLATQSPSVGFSLKEVHEMSEKLGMKLQMARRAPGAEVLLPAVVHWKVGHYAALQRRLAGSNYIVTQDLTFDQTAALSDAALDGEASGVFLVRSGPLPKGWSAVPAAEAGLIYGKGFTDGRGKKTPDCKSTKHTGSSCPVCPGMPQYSINLMQVALTVTDTPVGYSPPLGPSMDFTLRYHEEADPVDFTFGVGSGFASSQITHNWFGVLQASSLSIEFDVTLLGRHGGTRVFKGFDVATNKFTPEYNSGDSLHVSSVAPRVYELTKNDGSAEVYSLQLPADFGSSAERFLLTSVRDAHGNTATLHYDSQFRLIALTDAIGQVTTISHRPADPQGSVSVGAISRVTDPFGRFAAFDYLVPQPAHPDASPLSRITDTLGLVSDFEWDGFRTLPGSPGPPGGPGSPSITIRLISAMVTPYGRTTFQSAVDGINRRLTVIDPQGDAEVVEYKNNAPGIPPNAANPSGGTTDWMAYRNTFHWNKEAWGHHPEDYTKAVNYHWQHSDPSSLTGNTLESVKQPLENRVWFTHAGQVAPAYRGTYSQPSSTARFMDDGSVQRTFMDYNARGNVVREVDAAGRETTYTYAANGIDLLETRRLTGNGADDFARLSSATYNAQHLPLTTTGMDGMVTSYTWNDRGQLLTVTDPIGAVTTLGYNADGYLTSVNGPLPGAQDTITLTYDAYGRPATWTDVDGYMMTYQYDVMDRLTRTSYMDGTYEEYTYNRLDKATSRDREGRVTTMTYNALRQLVAQTDPANRTLRYQWCRCGKLRYLFDAMGRATHWDLDIQGRPKAKIYADGSRYLYEYERATSRLKRRTDAKGQFTDYQWTADDQIARISYPNAEIATPTCTYTYDPVFNRMTSAIAGPEPYYYTYHPITNGPALGAGRLAKQEGRYPDETLTYTYDARSLLTQRTIAGLAETWTFDEIGRILTNGTPSGPFLHTYDGASRRLATRSYPNGIRSTYSYFGNAGSRRLLQIRHAKFADVVAQFDYTYFPSGKIQTWRQQLGSAAAEKLQTFAYDQVDQLIGIVIGVPGNSQNVIYAYDLAGNRVLAQDGSQGNFAFSALNAPISTSAALFPIETRWDGANRISTIKTTTDEGSISYNALGSPISWNFTSSAVSERIIYQGNRVFQFGSERVKRFANGALNWTESGAYFTCFDHLNSPRVNLGDDRNEVRLYDPFGFESAGTSLSLRIGFTGHLGSDLTPSLLLAPFRMLNTQLGSWLNRDPIGEAGGVNIFSYAQNDPVNSVDVLGLETEIVLQPNPKHPNIIANAQKIRDPDMFQIIIHGVRPPGSPGSPAYAVQGPNGDVYPETLARQILSNPKYKKGSSVMLLACNTGQGPNSFAQQLATYLGVPVYAPDGYLCVSPEGDLTVGPQEICDGSGRIRPFYP